jgi:hypothetical protein
MVNVVGTNLYITCYKIMVFTYCVNNYEGSPICM